jgi:undecaprenyl pyrophosphate phosphatase UppP
MFIFLWIFIQIVAEVLPVSSSGHIFLLKRIYSCLSFTVPLDHPWQTIDFMLHVPTFLVLLIFFFGRWWQMIFDRPISTAVFFERRSWIQIARVLLFLGCSSTITTLFWWKRYYGYFAVPVSVGFVFTALALLALKFLPRGGAASWWARDGVVLGFVQGSVMNAGFSRFAFSLLAARLLGYEPRTALAVAFLIEMPLLFGAGARGLWEIYQTPEMFREYFAIQCVFVMLIATIVSYFVLQIVDRMVEKGKLHYVAGYMIIPFVTCLVFERCS